MSVAVGAALLGLSSVGVQAQANYPSHTITMVVPYPAGGTTDFLGRLIAAFEA